MIVGHLGTFWGHSLVLEGILGWIRRHFGVIVGHLGALWGHSGVLEGILGWLGGILG